MKQNETTQNEQKHLFVNGAKRVVVPNECASGTPQHFIQYYISQQKQIDKREQEKESMKEEEDEKNIGISRLNEPSLKCLEIRHEELKECFEELKKFISPGQKLVTEKKNKKKSKTNLQSLILAIVLIFIEIVIVWFVFFFGKF